MTAAEWSLGAAGPLLAREDDWQARARCRRLDPGVFFADDGASSEARAICGRCPVTASCRDYALAIESGHGRDVRYGIWAGLTPTERWRLDPLTGGDPIAREQLDRAASARSASEARAAVAVQSAAARLAAGAKTCARCRESKALDDFAARATSADGRDSWCRDCKSATRHQNARRAA